MIFKHTKIATRIGILAVVILALMLVLVSVEIAGLKSIWLSLDEVVNIHARRVQVAQEMRYQARHCAVLVRNVLIVSDEMARDREIRRFNRSVEEYRLLQQELAEWTANEEETRIVQQVQSSGELTFNLWRTVVESDDPTSYLDETTVIGVVEADVRTHQWGLLDGLQALVTLERELAQVAIDQARENYAVTKTAMIVVNLVALMIGGLFALIVSASIVRPLSEIGRCVDKIAGGDFSTRLNLDQGGEIGRLAGHIDHMAEKLQDNDRELNEYRYNLEELIEWRTGEVNEQRERFISVLIHDLKGPVIPVIGFSRLLMKKKQLSSEQINGYAKAIHDSASKLLHTVEQTSQDLREKRFAYSFDKTPFDMEELLLAVGKGFEGGLFGKGISIRINGHPPSEYHSSGKVFFLGDIGKMRSMLENLIGNAGKYAASVVDITITPRKEALEVVVDDDGCGVQQAFRSRIFEEYYQAPGSREGTGMGLYSVKRVVDHYQGTISVDTSPAGGARFVVWLPQEAMAQAPRA